MLYFVLRVHHFATKLVQDVGPCGILICSSAHFLELVVLADLVTFFGASNFDLFVGTLS